MWVKEQELKFSKITIIAGNKGALQGAKTWQLTWVENEILH